MTLFNIIRILFSISVFGPEADQGLLGGIPARTPAAAEEAAEVAQRAPVEEVVQEVPVEEVVQGVPVEEIVQGVPVEETAEKKPSELTQESNFQYKSAKRVFTILCSTKRFKTKIVKLETYFMDHIIRFKYEPYCI